MTAFASNTCPSKKGQPAGRPLHVLPRSVAETLDTAGRPLPESVQSQMENSFDHDFSRVRVHSNQKAAESARQTDAIAYTVGSHVVFGAGRYAPQSSDGYRLLRHELAHVVQQSSASSRAPFGPIGAASDHDTGEYHAHFAADAHGARAGRPLAVSPVLQRVSIWQRFLRLIGSGTYPHEELQAYLRHLDKENETEGDLFSDDKAREVVAHWQARHPSYFLTARLKALLVKEMLEDATLGGDENAILALLAGSNDSDMETILQKVGVDWLRRDIGGTQGERLEEILNAHRQRQSAGNAFTADETGGTELTHERLFDYLRALDAANRIQGQSDSHRLALEVIVRWEAGDGRYFLPVARKMLLIEELLHGSAGPEDQQAIVSLLQGANQAERTDILTNTKTSAQTLKTRISGVLGDELEAVLDAWTEQREKETNDQEGGPSAWIKDIDVNQRITQTVTLRWSDGKSDTDICSTGKGHCCVDENTPEGTACPEAVSNAGGSNCTPIGDFKITGKIKETAGGIDYWSTFEPGRSIALHDYAPLVDGTPLSHGCVRLRTPMAKKIYDGSKTNKTNVHVREPARPRCNWPALQAEWANDIRSAATKVPDGEAVPKEVRRRRQAIQSVTGLTDDALMAEITRLEGLIGPGYKGRSGLWQGSRSQRVAAAGALSKLVDQIPRCTPTQTIEELRLTSEAAPGAIIAASSFNPYVESFQMAVDKAWSYKKAQAVVRAHGLKLWQAAVDRAQATTPETDDRPLYWTRLKMMAYLRQYTPRWVKPPEQPSPDVLHRQKDQLLELFEQASRGMDTAVFETQEGIKKILISGFDPFGLHNAIDRGNPSGAAVLSLDGRQLTQGNITATVQGVVFPVRFGDFNAGIVERFFGPFIQSSTPPDMIMTISQGGGSQFEVERFASRARSSDDYPGNAQRTARGSLARPAQPQGLPAGPGFLETALPGHAIRAALGRSQALDEETEFMEIRPGENRPVPGGNQPTAGSRPVEGSGGGFLSNEIFYRTLLLRREAGATLPVGHLHTPYLAPPGNSVESRTQFANQRRAIVETIEKILRATLPHI